jgi:hypothetical protein
LALRTLEYSKSSGLSLYLRRLCSSLIKLVRTAGIILAANHTYIIFESVARDSWEQNEADIKESSNWVDSVTESDYRYVTACNGAIMLHFVRELPCGRTYTIHSLVHEVFRILPSFSNSSEEFLLVQFAAGRDSRLILIIVYVNSICIYTTL